MSCCDWEYGLQIHQKDCPTGLGDQVHRAAGKIREQERKKWRKVIEAAHDYINSEGDSWDNREIIEKGYAKMTGTKCHTR